MLPALTVGRLDAKVRLQKWEKVGEIRCGPQARAANETAGCGRTEGVSRHFALVIGSEGTPVDACKASGGSCRFVRGKSHGDEASRRLSGVVSGARLGGKAQGAGEAAVCVARYVLGSAVDLEPDRAGRILIPSELRQMCGLDREVALIGMGEHFELWDRSTLEAREREALAAELDAADFSF